MKSETIGPCTIYHGDSMDVMPALFEQGFKADLIACDPPYKLTSGGCPPSTGQRMSGCFNNDSYDNGGSLVLCDIDWSDFMPLFYSLIERGHCYTMANNRNVQAMLNAAESAGFGFHNLLIWDKITATPNRWYMKNCEFTGLFYKGTAQYINDCSSKQLIKCPQVDESQNYAQGGKGHPTEKPVALMKHYILNSTQPGQIVFDPFCGSGTTGVAAVQAGRKFVGIEKDDKFFDITCSRITEVMREFQTEMF